jgi:hypothetical protein
MSGGAGRTYHIESSMTDYMGSDGTQKITETLKVTDDLGNVFEQTMTHETDSNGDVTETQVVKATDKDGKTESEKSCTGKKCSDEDPPPPTPPPEDEDPPPPPPPEDDDTSGGASTPTPDAGDCTGQQCEEFDAFTEAFLGALATNHIVSQQTDPGSMMQPGVGTSPAGSRTDAVIDKAAKERLNPYILHDNAGDSSIPLPAGSNSAPTVDKIDTLVDPPRGDGSRPGGTPVPRDVSPDPPDATREPGEPEPQPPESR